MISWGLLWHVITKKIFLNVFLIFHKNLQILNQKSGFYHVHLTLFRNFFHYALKLSKKNWNTQVNTRVGRILFFLEIGNWYEMTSKGCSKNFSLPTQFFSTRKNHLQFENFWYFSKNRIKIFWQLFVKVELLCIFEPKMIISDKSTNFKINLLKIEKMIFSIRRDSFHLF